ncbi:MAG: hypothetical protein ACRECH_18340 [Nitrososphaerales archaeon]
MGKGPRTVGVPISIRIPPDIEEELAYIAAFNHKLNSSEQLREWIVEGANVVIRKAGYQTFKRQMEAKAMGK